MVDSIRKKGGSGKSWRKVSEYGGGRVGIAYCERKEDNVDAMSLGVILGEKMR
jgi:hypothetical protein